MNDDIMFAISILANVAVLVTLVAFREDFIEVFRSFTKKKKDNDIK